MNTRTLRHLIREYEIKYDLPSSGPGGPGEKGKDNRAKITSTLKTLLGLTVLTRVGVFLYDQKDAIFTFGSVVKAAITAIAAGGGLPESVEARVFSRILLEAEETYKTGYGEIKSAAIGALLKSNVENISSKKDYLDIPASIDAAITQKFNTIITDLTSKLNELNSIVTVPNKQSFPNNFSSFDEAPALISATDIDDTELKIAKNAMTDACAVAYYNSIHRQIESYLAALEALIEQDTNIDKKVVTAHVRSILGAYDNKITTAARDILTAGES